MERDREFLYLTPTRYTVTTRMLMHQGGQLCEPFQCFINCVGKVTRQCPQTTIFQQRGEPKRIEPRSFCLPAQLLTARPHRLTTAAVPRAHLFISLYLLGPTDNADPPTSPQMRPFLPKREAENRRTTVNKKAPIHCIISINDMVHRPL